MALPSLYRYNQFGRLTAIRRGEGVSQEFDEMQGSSSGTARMYTSMTGRLHVQEQTLEGTDQKTTKMIGPVKDITVYDSIQEELVTYKPNGMEVSYM